MRIFTLRIVNSDLLLKHIQKNRVEVKKWAKKAKQRKNGQKHSKMLSEKCDSLLFHDNL